MRELTWPQVLGHRLERHALLEPVAHDDLVALVGRLCGVHAQVASSAELSIGLRVAGADKGTLRRALWEDRTLVKTYGLRGTLHVFPAAELGLWLAALRAVPTAQAWDPMQVTGTSQTHLERMVEAVVGALDGATLTREELGTALERELGPWVGDKVLPAFADLWPRWHLALTEATRRGLVCFGPSQGNRVRFVRADQWLGPLQQVGGDEALAELFRRFLAAYGPATTAEFARWTNMIPAAAAALARRLGAELVEVDVEGDRRLTLATDDRVARETVEGSVRLLPAFDVYAVGGFPRDRLIPRAVSERLLQSPTRPDRVRSGREALSGPLPVLLVDGVVAGIWRRTGAGRRTVVCVDPFIDLTSVQRRRLDDEAQRLGAILGVEVSLVAGLLEARPRL